MLQNLRLLALTVVIGITAVPRVNAQTPSSSCYPNPPAPLADLVDAVVADILRGNRDSVSGQFSTLLAYTVADALPGTTSLVRQLQADVHLGEAARTDKQIGAPASATGTTNAIERPGLIELLGFAIETGAIQQELNDTTVTLSSSPYALVAAAEGDTPETYRDYELLSRLAASATFRLNDSQNVLANVTRNQLAAWSVQVRLSGDRSTRSEKFQEFWDREITPSIQNRLNVFERLANLLVREPAIFAEVTPVNRSNIVSSLNQKIADYLNANTAAGNSTKAAALKEMILCSLRTDIFDRIKTGALRPSDSTLRNLAVEMSNLSDAQRDMAAARVKLKRFLKQLAKSGTLSTFALTNHRVMAGSNYSELKLLFERHVRPLDLVANAAVSIYNNPDPGQNQERLRDFTLAFSLQGSSRNPLQLRADDVAAPVTYSLTGRYRRLMENEQMASRQPDIGSLQFRVDLPLGAGLNLPIAYTYSTATETDRKSENRFHIGMQFDLKKLRELLRARELLAQ